MKIALIGAGSFVFGPSALAEAFREQQLNGVELALMDVDPAPLSGMAAVGRRMIHENELTGSSVSTHTDRDAALAGADYVICCAAPGLRRAFATDREIIARLAPGHVVSEFGGVAGIGYSLRQIAFITELTDAMRRCCPSALLLTVSNPLPRVCQAAEESGVRTAGFCAVAETAYRMLSGFWGGDSHAPYPFAAPRAAWDVVTAGLNHHTFVVRFTERATGRDLLPELRERAAGGATCGSPRAERILRETGYLLVPEDEHTRDFWAPRPGETLPPLRETWHGSGDERAARIALLHAVGAGEEPLESVLGHPAWEKPLAFVAAHSGAGAARHFAALNLPNTNGQIAGLPVSAVVETPGTVASGAITPERFTLPEPVNALCERTAAVTDAIVRAARTRSRRLVHEAVLLDPTITDKAAGIAALDAVLVAHGDLLPAY